MKWIVGLAFAMVAVFLLVSEQLGGVRSADEPPIATEPGNAAAARTGAASSGADNGFAAEGVVLARDASGQFHVEARVNGTSIRFLVDTGADSVALTENDARAAGLTFDPDAFQPILRTASGEGWGTLLQVERIELGEVELRHVGVVVVRDLDVSLLGQSVLARMGKVEMQGDRMLIVPD
jgi:aspartyl protease family protein